MAFHDHRCLSSLGRRGLGVGGLRTFFRFCKTYDGLAGFMVLDLPCGSMISMYRLSHEQTAQNSVCQAQAHAKSSPGQSQTLPAAMFGNAASAF